MGKRRMSPERQRRVLATVERMECLQQRMPGIADEVCDELVRAVSKYPTFGSGHEGWAIIREELDELWEEVRERNPDRARMRAEAIQIAAMGMRFVMDVCGGAGS